MNEKQQDEIINKVMASSKEWYEDGKINETKFVVVFARSMSLKYINNSFYYYDGIVSDNDLKNTIFLIIADTIKVRVSNVINNIINSLENYCYIPNYKPQENIINVSNGTITIKNRKIDFNNDKIFSVNRLNVNYINSEDEPTEWLNYLNQLLNEQDIDILQEYIGYCLIPSLYAQKSLFIIGKGGEGKSVLGKVLVDIFGNSLVVDKIHSLFDGKFGLTNIDMKLIILDDDLMGYKLKDTALFKSLITGGKISYEKKFKDKTEIEPYAKFLALGNTMLQSCNDESDGFKRRLLILLTKDKDKTRKDNPYLVKQLIKEKSLILNWALKGLLRLINNDFEFSYSKEMEEKVEMLITNDNSKDICDFLSDEEYVILGDSNFTSTKDIYNHFMKYCRINNLQEINSSTFNKRLASIHTRYNLQRGKSKIDNTNQEIRGYIGISLTNQ